MPHTLPGRVGHGANGARWWWCGEESHRQGDIQYEDIGFARDLVLGAVMPQRVELPLGVIGEGRCACFEPDRVEIRAGGTFLQLNLPQRLIQMPERLLDRFHFASTHRPTGSGTPIRVMAALSRATTRLFFWSTA